jgi:transketolase
MGRTDEVLRLGRIADKLAAFGCETREVDGHDERALDAVFRELSCATWKGPKAIVAHTIKGAGVSFMAGENRWHYTRLNADTYAAAMAELGS